MEDEIVVTAQRLSDDGGGGGGGFGGWGDFGGGWGGGFGGAGWTGGGEMWWGGGDQFVFPDEPPPPEEPEAELTNPLYEEPAPETHLPYSVETYEDGTVIVRAYDYWNGMMHFGSIGPDGDTFTGSAGIDPSDFSNHGDLIFPPSDWGALNWA